MALLRSNSVKPMICVDGWLSILGHDRGDIGAGIENRPRRSMLAIVHAFSLLVPFRHDDRILVVRANDFAVPHESFMLPGR
jgi:hypothetical protein